MNCTCTLHTCTLAPCTYMEINNLLYNNILLVARNFIPNATITHYGKLKTLIGECNCVLIDSVALNSTGNPYQRYSPRPSVNTRYFKAEMPAAGVSALTFRSGAYAVAVGLSVLPTAAIGSAVVKVESASVNLRTIWRHCGGTGRAGLRRAYATCLRQLSAPRHPIWRPGRLLAGLLLHPSRLSQALSFDFLVWSPYSDLFDPVYLSFVFVLITIAIVLIVLLDRQ